MHFSLGEAAKQVTASKSTIRRAITSGKMTAERDGQGFKIEASELFRAFEAISRSHRGFEESTGSAAENRELMQEVDRLRARLETERAVLEEVRRERDALRLDRDHWRQFTERMFEALQKSLEG